MRSLAVFIFSVLAFAASPLAAQEIVYETVVLEEAAWLDGGSERYLSTQPAVVPQADVPDAIAEYGPFRVFDEGRAALVDVTDSRSPGAFRAMLRDFPGIAVIEMIDCPGTDDDRANLQLGRMIRARGMVTYVPAGGSVRSGAVELFLAGSHRIIDDGAEGYLTDRLDKYGKPVCSGIGAPNTTVGKFKNWIPDPI